MADTSAVRPMPSAPIPAGPMPPADLLEAKTAPHNPIRHTRTGVIWVGLIIFTVILLLLLVFIVQNTQPVNISFFAATGHVSLAVAMLLGTVTGVLLTAIAGSLRIWQLRRRLRHAIQR